jgi:hypothetical protein
VILIAPEPDQVVEALDIVDVPLIVPAVMTKAVVPASVAERVIPPAIVSVPPFAVVFPVVVKSPVMELEPVIVFVPAVPKVKAGMVILLVASVFVPFRIKAPAPVSAPLAPEGKVQVPPVAIVRVEVITRLVL